MSPKFYGYLWMAVGISAAVLWLGGVFTMLVGVVYGFICFGLVFGGMMCVLPGVVSHPSPKEEKLVVKSNPHKSAAKPVESPGGFSTYRSI